MILPKSTICNRVINAVTIQAKRLHDYDKGKTLGLGMSLGCSTDKNGEITNNVDLPVKYSFDDKKRDIVPTLGQGIIQTDSKT